MFPTTSPGLTQPTLPVVSAPSSAAGGAHRRHHMTRGVFAAPPLLAVLLLVLCSCGTGQVFPSARHLESAGQMTGIRLTSSAPRLTETFVSPTFVEVSERLKLVGEKSFASATCPTGDYALGGGWAVPDTQAMITSSVASGATWTIGVRKTGSLSGYASLYVECLAGATSAVVTQRSFNLSAPPNSSDVGGQSCDPGETLVGGGFDLSQSYGALELQSMYPTDDSLFGPPIWITNVYNHSSIAEPWTYYIECLSDVMAPTYPIFGSEQVNVTQSYPVSAGVLVGVGAAGDSATAAVACPAGYAVAGGGFLYEYVGAGDNLGLGNLSMQHTTANGWQAALYVEPEYGPTTFVAYAVAVCLTFG
jgi:hypothetical protein